MKNYKTTILGIIALIAGMLALILVYLERATLTEAGSYLGLVLAFVMGVHAFLTKDHDKDNNEDITTMDTGGVGPKRPEKDD